MKQLSIGNDALAVLMRYGWPGNVRQLAGVLFRAALQCDGSSLTADHFPHIAVQSRFTGRRTDAAQALSDTRSEQAIAGGGCVATQTRRPRASRMRNAVRELRSERGLSQGQLASAVGVSRQTINSIEQERYTPSLPLALALARFFETTVEAMFDANH